MRRVVDDRQVLAHPMLATRTSTRFKTTFELVRLIIDRVTVARRRAGPREQCGGSAPCARETDRAFSSAEARFRKCLRALAKRAALGLVAKALHWALLYAWQVYCQPEEPPAGESGIVGSLSF